MYYTRTELYTNYGNNDIFKRKRKQPIYHFNKINILIRNTYRPNTFSKCIQSILMQEYTNFRIIMCYDDDRCMEYLEEYRNHNKIELFSQEHLSSRTHDLENAYHDAGQFYFLKVSKFLKSGSLWTDNTGAIVISEFESQDIDNEVDWSLAELKYKALENL